MGGIGNQRAQLRRMSLLVPFLLAHPGTKVDELAAEFGASPDQIRKDLQTLSYCGLPGQGMGDLIEVVYDGDAVTITESAGMDRPLQLTVAEASSLVIALRSMAQSPGAVDHDTVLQVLAKLEDIIGNLVQSPVAVEPLDASPTAATLRAALADDRAVHMAYWTASRDAVSERTVDPVRLLRVDGMDYLEAWCRRVEAVRTFRLDRIDQLTVLDEPRTHRDVPQRDLSEGFYSPSEDDLRVELHVTRTGRWVSEYYDVTRVIDTADGGARIQLQIASDTLDRLVTQLGVDGIASYDDPHVTGAIARVRRRSAQALERYGT